MPAAPTVIARAVISAPPPYASRMPAAAARPTGVPSAKPASSRLTAPRRRGPAAAPRDAAVTSVAATTPGSEAAAAPSDPDARSAPVIVVWAAYIVVPSQTSPMHNWAMVPVATYLVSVSVVSLAMHPAFSLRRIDQGSYAKVKPARSYAPRRLSANDGGHATSPPT